MQNDNLDKPSTKYFKYINSSEPYKKPKNQIRQGVVFFTHRYTECGKVCQIIYLK